MTRPLKTTPTHAAGGMNRRTFLTRRLAPAVLLAAGAELLPAAPLLSAEPLPDIGVAKGAPAAATRAAVELLGGMAAFVSPGQKVCIKPNMSFANPPDWATTTHPEVVHELAAMCLEAGAADVRVLDYPLRSGALCLERSGIAAACAPLGSKVVVRALESASFFIDTAIPEGREMRENGFMRDALQADVLIAAPVAKSHGATGVSLALKGMMGLIWNRGALHSRYDLSEAIVDLNTLLRPQLTVIDATRVLSTNGPYGPGKVLTPDTVIASRDPVAADACTVARFEWWGRAMQPNQVKHIRLAHERGLGRMDLAALTIREVAA